LGKCTWPPNIPAILDIKAKVSAADTTTDYLNSKIAVAGGLTKTILNPGANEQLQISAPAAADIYVKATAADTTASYLDSKLAVSGEFTKSILLPAGNEQVKISSTYKTRFLPISDTSWRVYGGTVPFFGDANFGSNKVYRVINFPTQTGGNHASAMTSILMPENWDQSNILLRLYYNRQTYDANNFDFDFQICGIGNNEALNPAGVVSVTKLFNTSHTNADRLYLSTEWSFPVQIAQPQGGLIIVKFERGADSAAGQLCLYGVRVRYGVV